MGQHRNQMAGCRPKKEYRGAEPRGRRKHPFVLRFTRTEVEHRKLPFAGDRAQHFVNQHYAGRPSRKCRVVSGKKKAQAVANRGAIAEGDWLLAMKQKITSHRASGGVLVELGAKGIGVGQSAPEQAILIRPRRESPGESEEIARFLRRRVPVKLDRLAAGLQISAQLALDFMTMVPRQALQVIVERRRGQLDVIVIVRR